jgi:hypothetical protein
MAELLVLPYDEADAVRFDWDDNKDEANHAKHGVSFAEAQMAFLDPRRVIARDLGHSRDEDRLYCIGQTKRGILTVRFTIRDEVIRIIGAGF